MMIGRHARIGDREPGGGRRVEAKQVVYVLRHGETEWSKSGQHTSVTDLPLTDAGRAQAERLKGLLVGRSFSLVLSSPLRRARETCRLAGFENQMQIEPDLHEWRYGRYEGRTTAQIHEIAPGWDVFRGPNPDGESPNDISARVDRLIVKVRAAAGDVALFAHGHVLRAVAARWLDLPIDAARHFKLETGTISRLGYEHSWPTVLSWNAR